MASGCYVYAILACATPLPPGLLGFGGAALAVVPWRALAAATSPVERQELRPTPEHLLRHEAIVEAVRQVGRALPVRFGTVLADGEAVSHALAERYDVLLADLERLGDKVELGLSVLWDGGDLTPPPPSLPGKGEPDLTPPPPSLPGKGEPEGREACAPDGRGASLAPLPTSPGRGGAGEEVRGPGVRYLLARLAEDRREAELRARAGAIARAVDEALCPYALERRCTVLPTPRLALRAAYLLEPVRIGAFWAAFEQVRRARPDLRCLLSGPWPPYSFVTPKVPGPTSNAQSPGFPLDFGPWTLE